MKRLLRGFSPALFIVSIIISLSACSPAPRHTLTLQERVADLHWLFSQFSENYAPLSYKEEKYKFNFEDLKQKYLNDAANVKTNEEFYLLMHRFVAEFKDAHTGSMLFSSSLPNRTKVAYLGFDGIRVGANLKVKKLLPTFAKDANYPIKVGDVISKLDGVELKEVVNKDFAPYRNLGQDESNYTYLMPKIFNRLSLSHPMPAQSDATLTVIRDKKDVTVVVPWIVKDLLTFTDEQRAASPKKKEEPELMVGALTSLNFFDLATKLLNKEVPVRSAFIQKFSRELGKFDFRNTYDFIDTAPTWNSPYLARFMSENANDPTPKVTELKEERTVPNSVIFVNPMATYPTYISAEKVLDKDKKATGAVKPVGYMYLDTFSPAAAEANVIKEVTDTLKTLKTFGVKDLVIDMINNGGGSLTLGLKLAQAFSGKHIIHPDLQFKVSETWMDEFEMNSRTGSSDAEKEIARRVFTQLVEERGKNQMLSRKWDSETLMPFQFTPNAEADDDMHIYLLVNEMCASMCDIFTAVMKDNKLATVIGSKTMGAGGNVVSHREAPNSHLIVNQTESLIVRRDGSYIENNGVEPDVAVDVNATADEKYNGVRAKAIELIVSPK